MHKLRDMVKEDFAARCKRNSSFSLRAYARWLGVNQTSLSLFLRGERQLSAKNKKKVLTALLPGQSLIDVNTLDQESRQELEEAELAVISDWYYFAILSLFETHDFQPDPTWISDKLCLPLQTVKDALTRLERLQMLRRDANGKLHAAGITFTTSDQKISLALQKGHLQALELARWAITHENVNKREVSAMTMAIDPNRLPEAQRRIKSFRRRLCRYLEGGQKQQVYRLSVQLFPLSHTKRTPWKPTV